MISFLLQNSITKVLVRLIQSTVLFLSLDVAVRCMIRLCLFNSVIMCQFLLPSYHCSVDGDWCRHLSGMSYLSCGARSLEMSISDRVPGTLGDCLTCPDFRKSVCSYFHGVYDVEPCCDMPP